MKKLYIQPVTESQLMHCTSNLCVGSVHDNLGLDFIGNTDEEPI